MAARGAGKKSAAKSRRVLPRGWRPRVLFRRPRERRVWLGNGLGRGQNQRPAARTRSAANHTRRAGTTAPTGLPALCAANALPRQRPAPTAAGGGGGTLRSRSGAQAMEAGVTAVAGALKAALEKPFHFVSLSGERAFPDVIGDALERPVAVPFETFKAELLAVTGAVGIAAPGRGGDRPPAGGPAGAQVPGGGAGVKCRACSSARASAAWRSGADRPGAR